METEQVDKFVIFLIITFSILLIMFGIGLDRMYESFSEKRHLSGLWFNNESMSFNDVKERAQLRDTEGEWICVNIRGMTIMEMITTCEHEAAHEIFAQKCETNATKCLREVGVK